MLHINFTTIIIHNIWFIYFALICGNFCIIINQVPEKNRVQVPEKSRVHVPEKNRVQVPEKSRVHVPEKSRVQVPEKSFIFNKD